MIGRQSFDLNSIPEMTMSDHEDTHDPQPKRKRYEAEIQETLEAFFEECTHPNDTQRSELSRQLGIEVQHIKSWFQNKRARMRSQNTRQVNSQLQRELRQQNMRYKEALENGYCATCGASMRGLSSDEHEIRTENARIREENESIAAMVAKYVGRPLNSGEASSSMANPPQEQLPSTKP